MRLNNVRVEHSFGCGGPPNGDALALTSGRGNAFLTDDRIESLGHLHDELIGVRMFGCSDDFLLGSTEPAQFDVRFPWAGAGGKPMTRL
jgi:hypothetical protein